MNGVHADPVVAELERGDLRHAADRELARAVGGHPGHAAQPGDRRDVHDRAPARAPQRGNRRLHAEEAAHLVDVHDLEVVRERHRFDRTRARDAGVVDQRVEPPEAVLRRGDAALPVRSQPDVERLVDRAVADLCGDLGAGLVPHVADHHARALAREQARLRLALPARRARDQHHLAFDAPHRR